MPGRLFLTCAAVHFGTWQTPALIPRRNIAPGEMLWALTEDGFQEMRWGLIPTGRRNARGRPVMETIVNARGETVFDKSVFSGLRRAAIPAQGWYEWTGPKGRKKIWEIRDASGDLLWFAAIWDVWQAPGGSAVAQVATVTCPPNADVRDVHDRMGVLLDKDDLLAWLTAPETIARGLVRPTPDGRLALRIVDQAVLDGAS